MYECHDIKLVTRQRFERYLEQLAASYSSQSHHALLYAQLYSITIGRDINGQMTVEALVQHVVQLLRTGTSQHDALTLLGPEKFAVLLQDCPPEQALQVARLMRTAIQNSLLWWQGDTLKFSVNIGLVLFNHYSDTTVLLSAAHQACCSAKDKGHNSIHIVRLD